MASDASAYAAPMRASFMDVSQSVILILIKDIIYDELAKEKNRSFDYAVSVDNGGDTDDRTFLCTE